MNDVPYSFIEISSLPDFLIRFFIIAIKREGEAIQDFMSPDRIVLGGMDAKSIQVQEKLYEVLIAFADSENNMVKMSARTSYALVERGIDLGEALRQVVKKIDSKLQAGGHNIAAGGKVPKGSEKQVLTMLDKVFNQQIRNPQK